MPNISAQTAHIKSLSISWIGVIILVKSKSPSFVLFLSSWSLLCVISACFVTRNDFLAFTSLKVYYHAKDYIARYTYLFNQV